MRNILLITSSPSGEQGFSTRFATELADSLAANGAGRITTRDLSSQPLPHIDAAYVQGRAIAAAQRDARQSAAISLAEQLISELRQADIVVIGSAMINFAPATQLKAWFDYVIWPGVTVQFGAHGAEGLITGKKVYLVTAAGGHYGEGQMAAMDHQSGYLRQLLGFIGLSDVEQILVEGVAYGDAAVQAASSQARASIARIAASVAA